MESLEPLRSQSANVESLRPGWILRRSSAGHPNSCGGTTSTEACRIPTAFREPFQPLHRTHFSQVLEMGEMVTEALTYLTIFGNLQNHAKSTFQIVSIVESSLLRGYEALLSIAEAAAKERKSLLKSQGNSETEGMAQEWCRNAAKLVGIILRWSKNHQTWGIYNWSIRIWIIHGWNWRISSTIHFLISILLSHALPILFPSAFMKPIDLLSLRR